MSDLIEIKVPDLGGSTEVEVVEVLVQPGDIITLEQTLAVLESDKATMDMPSTAAGTVQEVKIRVGGKVSQGDVIAVIAAAEQKPAAPEAEPARAEAITRRETRCRSSQGNGPGNAFRSYCRIRSSTIGQETARNPCRAPFRPRTGRGYRQYRPRQRPQGPHSKRRCQGLH